MAEPEVPSDSPARSGPTARAAALAAVLLPLLAAPAFAQIEPPPEPASDSAGAAEPTVTSAPYRFSGEFRLLDLTSRAREGDFGFSHEGDDTRSSTAATLRLMWSDSGAPGASWEVHYANVKLDSAGGPVPGETGAGQFRYESLRWSLERAETDRDHPSSSQTVTWFQELDRASAGWRGSGWELNLGRQPITWGAGRFWQPLDLFGTFAPTELEREFKPGVDALVAQVFPTAFSSVAAAYVASPADESIGDSAVLHGRVQVGAVSEVTALAGTVRERAVAGGALETSLWDAGWRVEALVAQVPEAQGDDYVFVVAGVDRQFESGITAALEWYRHSAGAQRAEDLTDVALSAPYRQGTLQQLSQDVAGASLQKDLTGLLNGSYTLLAGQLAGDPISTLHQATLTYSISDEADAVFSLITATGPGLERSGRPRSEFGHVPDSLYARIRFYF